MEEQSKSIEELINELTLKMKADILSVLEDELDCQSAELKKRIMQLIQEK